MGSPTDKKGDDGPGVSALITERPEGKPKKVAIYFPSYKHPGMHDFRIHFPSSRFIRFGPLLTPKN
jgi:hypothetical protein